MPHRFLVSGYTNDASTSGTYLYELDERSDVVHLLGSVSGVESPSFITLAGPTHNDLYAAYEMPSVGGLAHFTLSESGLPELSDVVAFSSAAGTCFSLVHPEGKQIYGADYDSGSVCACALAENGSILEPATLIQHVGRAAPREPNDPNFDRQTSPHVHTLSIVPSNDRLLAAVDLGLDSIFLYELADDGAIVEPPAAIVETPTHSGPRIIAYHPSGDYAALVCELSCELIIYRISHEGLIWQPLHRWSLLEAANPADRSTLSSYPPLAAHAQFSKNGRFLYASVRGTDQLICFTLGEDLKPLSAHVHPSGGSTPRHFSLSSDERFLAVANQVGNNVTIFHCDTETGQLEQATSLPTPTPSCIVWL